MKDLISKTEELSLFLIRMCLENVDFLKVDQSLLASSAIFAAVNVLKRSKIFNSSVHENTFIEISKHCLISSRYQFKIDLVENTARQMLEFY